MTTTALVPSTKAAISDPRLKRHADRIRDLMADVANNSLALGRELFAAKNYLKSLSKGNAPAGWQKWVGDEFNINFRWADILIRASKRATRANRHLAPEVIAIITAEPASEAHSKAITEIKQRVAKAGKVSRSTARAIMRKHKHGGNGSKMPSPSEARDIAARHHIIVAASDGRLYTGASEDAIQKYSDKRTIVYGVRRALDTLAAVGMTAEEFLDYAEPHQLWKSNEEAVIKQAHEWLSALRDQWSKPKWLEKRGTIYANA